jgi:anaerobic selenocysteine-containing dehydrogenase
MMADYRIVRTMCDLCHCECGVLAHVQDGKLKSNGYPQLLGFYFAFWNFS